jgi:hypothetical protein
VSKWKVFLAFVAGIGIAALLFGQVQHHPLNFGTSAQRYSNPYPGQPWITWDNLNTAPATFNIYDHISANWNTLAQLEEAQTWSAVQTYTATPIFASVTVNGSITLGDNDADLVTVAAPLAKLVHRDNFCGIGVLQTDFTAESLADNTTNFIYTTVGQYFQRMEGTNTLSTQTALVNGECGLDVSGDVTDNEGTEIIFAEQPLLGVHQIQAADTAATFYFEISLTITDISAVDGDLAFGLKVPEALQDPPQHDGLNTYFIATLSDNAGDLDFEADVDGGGAANDDSGITWADTNTKVVRFEINTDGYAATVDGTAITLTNCNATGANDFTDLDKVVPFYYHTQGSEGAATGIIINYIEYGLKTQ